MISINTSSRHVKPQMSIGCIGGGMWAGVCLSGEVAAAVMAVVAAACVAPSREQLRLELQLELAGGATERRAVAKVALLALQATQHAKICTRRHACVDPSGKTNTGTAID